MQRTAAALQSTFCVFAIGAFSTWRALQGSRSLILCLVRSMTARVSLPACVTVFLLAACAYNEQLRPRVVCHQYISGRDIAEIRDLLLSRPDVRKPLWGLTCDKRGRLLAESGGLRPGPAIGSFVTLVRRNGKWQIIKIEEGPVMAVEVSSVLR